MKHEHKISEVKHWHSDKLNINIFTTHVLADCQQHLAAYSIRTLEVVNNIAPVNLEAIYSQNHIIFCQSLREVSRASRDQIFDFCA